MKEKIIEISKEIEIDVIGFAEVRNHTELYPIYKKQFEENKYTSFQNIDIGYKTNLKDKFPEYNTVIAIGVGYNSSKEINLAKEEVILSSSSWGKDYHKVLTEKLEMIGNLLLENNYKYQIFVDNNPLDERYLAYKAGIGFYGKNNLLINKNLGPNFFIGIILTDLVTDYENEYENLCTNCNLCKNNCPTKALEEEIFDGNKCLSYITQKKDLEECDKKYMNNMIYGCDICMNSCPFQKINIGNSIFNKSNIETININQYKHLSNKKWQEKYKNNSCSWRGRNIFERNINIYKEKLEKK